MQTRIAVLLSSWGRLLVVALVMILLVCPAPGQGAEVKVTPRASIREAYDTNLLFKNVEDLEHAFSPGIEVSSRTDQGKVTLSGDLDVFRYMEHDDFDRENQRYKLDSEYALTPVWTFGFQGGLNVDYTIDTSLEETGIVAEKSRRLTSSAIPSASWRVGETDTVQIQPAYSRTYDSNQNNADYTITGGDLIWSRAVLSGKDMLFADIGAHNVRFELLHGSGDQFTKQALVGYAHAFSEQLTATLKGGPTLTDSKFSLPGRNIDESKHGYTLDGQVAWTLERTRITLAADRGLTQSVYGENITRNRARLNLLYDLTDRWKAGFNYSCLMSKTDALIRRSETTSQSFNPFFRYSLTEDADLNLGWIYQGHKNDVTDEYRLGNRYYLMFTIRFPKTY